MPATAAELQMHIAQCNGFENHYKHRLFPGLTYSDGVKYIAENGGAYWLIDAIFSHSKAKNLQAKCEGLEFWKLTVKEGQGVLVCTDGGIGGKKAKIVAKQEIPHTDFPLPEINLYLENGILLLPGER